MMGTREFEGRRIKKTTIEIGKGGNIEYDGATPPTPESRLLVQTWVDYGSIKHKYNEDGTVTEMLILTIDTGTFEILQVKEPPPKPIQDELPTSNGETEKPKRGRKRSAVPAGDAA